MASSPTSDPQRFGPNIYWWLMVVFAASLVGGIVWVTWLLLNDEGRVPLGLLLQLLVFACLLGLILIKAIEAWGVFRLDDEGMHLKRVGRRRFVPWQEIRRVGNRDVGVGGLSDEYPVLWGDRGRFQEGSTDRTAFTFLVHDLNGEIVFRIPPWTSRRKELVRQIQIRTRPWRKTLKPPRARPAQSPRGARATTSRILGRTRRKMSVLRRRRVKDRKPGDALGSGMKWVGIQLLLAAVALFAIVYGDGAWNYVALVAVIAWTAIRYYRWFQR